MNIYKIFKYQILQLPFILPIIYLCDEEKGKERGGKEEDRREREGGEAAALLFS